MENLTGEQRFQKEREELERELNAGSELPTANIIVAGIAGVGKSTLINAVFGSKLAATGIGRPITPQIAEYQDGDIPIRIWDTVGLELDAEKTRQSIKDIKATIASKASSNSPYDRIHAIWYCVNSYSSRYMDAEYEFIKELHAVGVPFVIVLTQCSGDEEEVNAFEEKIRKINHEEGMEDIGIVQVLALPVKLRGIPTPIPAFGLDKLVTMTLEMLPAFIRSGFIAAQRVSWAEKRNACDDIICKYVRAAQYGFWDKVPLVNIIITDRRIIEMFRTIVEMYNTVLPEDRLRQITKKSEVTFENNFFGLISPIDMGYSKKITALLAQKKEEGFEVPIVEKRDRAARMIAFYGYTFVDAIEQLWRELTEEQLNNVDMVVSNLIRIVDQKLKERKGEVRRI